MKSLGISLFSLCVIAFLNSCSNLPMQPSKTSLTTTYGTEETEVDNGKDKMKDSYKLTLKQDWTWDNKK